MSAGLEAGPARAAEAVRQVLGEVGAARATIGALGFALAGSDTAAIEYREALARLGSLAVALEIALCSAASALMAAEQALPVDAGLSGAGYD